MLPGSGPLGQGAKHVTAPLTTRLAAQRITATVGPVAEWQVRRLFLEGDLPEPPTHGRARLINEDQLPAIIAALRCRGWLPAEQAEVANA
jgi:hypothetical protein